MVNADKHRRKAVENDLRRFIGSIDGTNRRQLYKKTEELDSQTKPKLASEMNMNHFRPQLKQEQQLRRNIF
ncbi:MAG: hypothetical protein IKG36_00925 [Mycoplasmataceae bacterium]|nr:hypothetical protein [Mycoplasmataceae bacterium]